MTIENEEPPTLTKYGRMRERYLREHRKILYINLLTSGKLYEHLADIDTSACDMAEYLIKEMARKQGVTEELKGKDIFIKEDEKSLSFGDNRIAEAIEKYHAKLLILDPMSSYIGENCSMNNANETRAEFNHLIAVAKNTGCAIVIIAHMNKMRDTNPLYRTNGSIDIAGAARSILAITRTPNKEAPAERYMVQVKSNLAPTGSAILFEVAEKGVDFISEMEMTAEEAFQSLAPKMGRPNEKEIKAKEFLLEKLIARGVPADEIKFIHEADTEAKKLELFKKVRRGDVRILMGSTQKMGAGTNVQNKLAASSDLDCPWRPSDLEQRLGRSIRQGNENAEVHIYRFVTEETFDAYLYQLVEGKQKFASQIMTSKSPVRSCEDIDETALSYAEIKMLATGNPHIKEKMDLDIQVQKLRLLKSSFLSEKYALEDKIIKFYPQEIARLADVIAGLKSDMERVAEHPKPSDETFVGMTVKGAFYSEKADAGNAILEACKAMTNPEPIPLGEYRGFTMELYFEAREYKVRLKGELGYPVTLGTDTFGNITRLDNALEGLPKRLEMNEMELDNIKKQFETAKVDVERPFPQEEELKTKTDRLNELNALLNVDKRENEIVGGEPDEGEEPPEKKPRDLER